MTDETPKKRTRRPLPASADGAPPAADPGAAGGANDPDAALRRLESMGTAPAGAAPDLDVFAGPEPLPPAPVVDPFSAPPPSRPQRPMGGSKRTPRTPRSRPRTAGGSMTTRTVARIAAPIVFLVAVIALIGIVVNSGVMGGSDQPSVTPTVKATKTVSVTKKYVVKTGDSLSSIADRFHTTTADLLTLNPDLTGSTLVVGQRIVVPAQ